VGLVLAVRPVPLLVYPCLLGAGLIVARGIARGMSPLLVAVSVAVFWMILGLLATAFFS